MRNFLFPARQVEATPNQVATSGAFGGNGFDPVDGDYGYTQLGAGSREQPRWTTEKARTYSVAAYRTNPMGRATIDTYTSFGVGDSGVSIQCSNAQVHQVVAEWWDDPAVQMAKHLPLMMRDWMLMGEVAQELLVTPSDGACYWSPIDVQRVQHIGLRGNNPLWPDTVYVTQPFGVTEPLSIMRVDPITGLRSGRVLFEASWKATLQDRRGTPFLSAISDALDAYAETLSNLIDRTAIMRHIAYDVTLKGEQADVDGFLKKRGGNHIPRSGTIEVHNEAVEWKPMSAEVGSAEDTNTLAAVLTDVAAGGGLAKTWLADPGDSNRATSMSMGEPVRRRLGGVQNDFMAIITEHARFVVDQAVAVGRLPRFVESQDIEGNKIMIPAAQSLTITGPEIAAADTTVAAAVLVNVATGLEKLVDMGALSRQAAAVAAQKTWEQITGMPFRQDMAVPADFVPTPKPPHQLTLAV